VSAVILAGGRSERLGRDKATLVLGGQLLTQRVAALVGELSDETILVLRPDQPSPLPRVRTATDLVPYAGVLAGIAAGLAAAREEWALLVACDMPFLNLALLRHLLSLRGGQDIVVPLLGVGAEPLHALYHRRCLPAILQALREQRRRVISFYEALRVRYVQEDEVRRFDPALRSFFNINTPEDHQQAAAWLAEEPEKVGRPA
jgi:molybdopterin-guanine dinucleotide biosynthesis protein A